MYFAAISVPECETMVSNKKGESNMEKLPGKI
jgi:hypothetical protein